MSQRSRSHFHARRLLRFGMALQAAVQRAEGGQFVNRKEPAMRKARIEHGAGMSLGKDEAVSIFPFGIGRIDPKLMKVEASENLRNGECSANVAGLAAVHHSQHH